MKPETGVKYQQFPAPPNRKKHVLYFLIFACPTLSIALLCLNNYMLGRIYAPTFTFDTQNIAAYQKQNRVFPGLLDVPTGPLKVDLVDDLPPPPVPDAARCGAAGLQVDCQPRGAATQESCAKLGCCFQSAQPRCFYPSGYGSYKLVQAENTTGSFSFLFAPNFKSPFSQATNVTLIATFLSNETLMIDLGGNGDISKNVMEGQATPDTALYSINVDDTGFQVIRKSNGRVLWDTKNIGGFHVASLFFQMTTRLPSDKIYGLGDNIDSFPIDLNWKTKTIFAHDAIPSKDNGYSYLPAYLCVEEDRKAHHVIMHTLTATDFVLQPGALTVRSIQGRLTKILISLGDSPIEAIQAVPMDSALPPYWSLGFHLSRFGYKSVNHVLSIFTDMVNAQIPFDTQWLDIDYMDNRNDFTIGPNFKELPNLAKFLHGQNRKLVLIVDPGISASEAKGSYAPYDEGLKRDIFIKDHTGKAPILGKVWNRNYTVFPDFINPSIFSYWTDMLGAFRKVVNYDGLWIDMNEPSNFVNGSVSGCPPDSPMDHPPYVPGVAGGDLSYHTLCMSALQFGNTPHYLLHNMYGFSEDAATRIALTSITKKRAFVISRSVLPFSQGHWTGDVRSTWEDMAQSVKDLLNYSIFGVSMVGADICGFNGNTTVELCRRWSQLGAFYPFSRNHNTDDGIPQDPVSLGIVDSTRNALLLRYSLLPYLYTLFWESVEFKLPVIRPSFFMFDDFEATYNLTTQFFLGESILVVPVLEKGFTYVKAYLGHRIWYDLRTNLNINVNQSMLILPAPEDTIPVLLLGGRIVPMQQPSTTTYQTRKNPMFLKVALNQKQEAIGNVYLDDGESLRPLFSTVGWYAFPGRLESHVEFDDFKTDVRLTRIEIFAVPKVSSVTLDQKACNFTYNQTSRVLNVNLDVPIVSAFTVIWK